LKTKEKIREQVKWFFLFHLGFDAQVLIQDERSGLRVSVQHDRIRWFTFVLNEEQLKSAVRTPSKLEDLLLDELNKHRQ
jgi:hypothetical protein